MSALEKLKNKEYNYDTPKLVEFVPDKSDRTGIITTENIIEHIESIVGEDYHTFDNPVYSLINATVMELVNTDADVFTLEDIRLALDTEAFRETYLYTELYSVEDYEHALEVITVAIDSEYASLQ